MGKNKERASRRSSFFFLGQDVWKDKVDGQVGRLLAGLEMGCVVDLWVQVEDSSVENENCALEGGGHGSDGARIGREIGENPRS